MTTKNKLDMLGLDLSNLSSDELFELVRSIRADRKVSKKLVRTTTKKARRKAADKLADMLANMSPEARKRVMKELESK